MKPATLEAWQVYAARCRRLDREEARSRSREAGRAWTRWEVLVLLLTAEAALLTWVGGLL